MQAFPVYGGLKTLSAGLLACVLDPIPVWEVSFVLKFHALTIIMGNCRNEITNEEYFAYLDAPPAEGYPKKFSYKGKEYVLIAKNFNYTGKIHPTQRHMLSVEIWDAAIESKKFGIVLVKSDNCRFHSPPNPNFNMVPELFATDEGKFLLEKVLEVLKAFNYAFLVEEIFGEDVGYNSITKSYDKAAYARLRDFYTSLGFTFTFSKPKGHGVITMQNSPLSPDEKKCFAHVKKEAAKTRPVPIQINGPILSG